MTRVSAIIGIAARAQDNEFLPRSDVVIDDQIVTTEQHGRVTVDL